MARSLRRQLLAWTLGPLAVLAALNAYAGRQSARAAADLVTDRMLLASARTIAEQTRIEDGLMQALVPPAALEMFDTGEGDFVYVRVAEPGGRLLAGMMDLPGAGAGAERPAAVEADYRGRPLRSVALRQSLAGAGAAAVVVTVGVTTSSRDAMVRHLWLTGSAQQFVLIGAAGLFITYGLKRGLAPLLRLGDTVRSRQPRSLDPLDDGAVQTELRPLVVALNRQTARVAGQLAAQHRFVTNAAHQLRTPLTLLNVQATYALRHLGSAEAEPALRALQAGTTQVSRLAGQLLTLSRAEPGSRRERADRIDLGGLAAGILDGFATIALARAIDLGLDARRPVEVLGDRTMLGEMLANLVDNAIRYGRPRGTVTLGLDREGGDAVIEVRDDGPGVPEAEQERIFERFYRVPGTQAEGSGLGLAIVREVAQTAGGTVTARAAEGGGLAIEIRLPAADATVSDR